MTIAQAPLTARIHLHKPKKQKNPFIGRSWHQDIYQTIPTSFTGVAFERMSDRSIEQITHALDRLERIEQRFPFNGLSHEWLPEKGLANGLWHSTLAQSYADAQETRTYTAFGQDLAARIHQDADRWLQLESNHIHSYTPRQLHAWYNDCVEKHWNDYFAVLHPLLKKVNQGKQLHRKEGQAIIEAERKLRKAHFMLYRALVRFLDMPAHYAALCDVVEKKICGDLRTIAKDRENPYVINGPRHRPAPITQTDDTHAFAKKALHCMYKGILVARKENMGFYSLFWKKR